MTAPTAAVLEGRVALVTGASRGIGRAIALALADAGAHVAVNYRSRGDDAAAVVHQIVATGRRALAVGADVSCAPDVDRMVAETTSGLGPIDILISNAGIARP